MAASALRTAGLGLLLWAAVACSNQQELAPAQLDYGYGFFPLDIGRSWTYTVDSVVFVSQGNGVVRDSSFTFAKETLVDTFRAADGTLFYRGERFERKNPSEPWAFSGVFALARTDRQAIRLENNLQIVLLPFPNGWGATFEPWIYFGHDRLVSVGGESIMMYKDWLLSVVDDQASYPLGDSLLQPVRRLENIQYESKNNWREAYFSFAEGVGLVTQQLFILDTNCDLDGSGSLDTPDEINCEALPPEDQAVKGFILQQRLIDYQ